MRKINSISEEVRLLPSIAARNEKGRLNIQEAINIVADKYKLSKNPDDYEYMVLIALHADEPNCNGDAFTLEELERFDPKYGCKVYQSFTLKPHFIEHRQDGEVYGFVLDSHLEKPKEGNAYVELCIAVDKTKDPVYGEMVKNGEVDKFSMGCSVDYTVCNVCGNESYDEASFCNHILNHKMSTFKVADENGNEEEKLAYEKCFGVVFDEISAVGDPADEGALKQETLKAAMKKRFKKLEKLSKKKAQNDFDIDELLWEELKEYVGAIISKYGDEIRYDLDKIDELLWKEYRINVEDTGFDLGKLVSEYLMEREGKKDRKSKKSRYEGSLSSFGGDVFEIIKDKSDLLDSPLKPLKFDNESVVIHFGYEGINYYMSFERYRVRGPVTLFQVSISATGDGITGVIGLSGNIYSDPHDVASDLMNALVAYEQFGDVRDAGTVKSIRKLRNRKKKSQKWVDWGIKEDKPKEIFGKSKVSFSESELRSIAKNLIREGLSKTKVIETLMRLSNITPFATAEQIVEDIMYMVADKKKVGAQSSFSRNQGHIKKVSRLIKKYREETERKEWALVSKDDASKILKWFGPEKPSKEEVQKEEQRVQYFKSKGRKIKKVQNSEATNYKYWMHTVSGDVYAVGVNERGEVVESVGPLYYKEYQEFQPEDFRHNMITEDNEWFNENSEDFVLKSSRKKAQVPDENVVPSEKERGWLLNLSQDITTGEVTDEFSAQQWFRDKYNREPNYGEQENMRSLFSKKGLKNRFLKKKKLDESGVYGKTLNKNRRNKMRERTRSVRKTPVSRTVESKILRNRKGRSLENNKRRNLRNRKSAKDLVKKEYYIEGIDKRATDVRYPNYRDWKITVLGNGKVKFVRLGNDRRTSFRKVLKAGDERRFAENVLDDLVRKGLAFVVKKYGFGRFKSILEDGTIDRGTGSLSPREDRLTSDGITDKKDYSLKNMKDQVSDDGYWDKMSGRRYRRKGLKLNKWRFIKAKKLARALERLYEKYEKKSDKEARKIILDLFTKGALKRRAQDDEELPDNLGQVIEENVEVVDVPGLVEEVTNYYVDDMEMSPEDAATEIVDEFVESDAPDEIKDEIKKEVEDIAETVEAETQEVVEEEMEDVREKVDEIADKVPSMEEMGIDEEEIEVASSRRAKELNKAFRDKFYRALKLAATRQLLNIDTSGLFAIKDELCEELIHPHGKFGGLKTDTALDIIERSFRKVLSSEAIDEFIKSAERLMEMNDDAFNQIEDDIRNLSPVSVSGMSDKEKEASKNDLTVVGRTGSGIYSDENFKDLVKKSLPGFGLDKS